MIETFAALVMSPSWKDAPSRSFQSTGMDQVGTQLDLCFQCLEFSWACMAQSPRLGGVDRGAKRDGTRGL